MLDYLVPPIKNGRSKMNRLGSPINKTEMFCRRLGMIRTQRDRGKGVPSFDEMMDIALVAVDFDDPTTNVRGRRALAIAKPTPRGY